MIGGAIPTKSKNPINDWRKSVQTNLSALDYQIYPISTLFTSKEFQDLNITNLTSSFTKGLTAYC
jgi:MAC/Perforin domain